jgi:hypothetical protein
MPEVARRLSISVVGRLGQYDAVQRSEELDVSRVAVAFIDAANIPSTTVGRSINMLLI